ncbi:hypothetical protein YC2023_045721 [Brassica napus]
MVETQYRQSIAQFQCDGGGEFSPSETETEALAEDLPTHVVKQVIIPQAQLPQSPVQEQNVQEQNVPDESATESSSGSSSSQSDDDNDVVQQVVPPIHTMTTRARAGIIKPNPRYAMVTVKASHSEPRSLKAALQDPGWYGAMEEEVDNMVETETFELVPPEENQHPVGCGWVHEVKLNADGSVLKLRSRLVARGNEQEEAQTEKKEKTVGSSQPKNATLSSSEKPVSKQVLRKYCTTKPAHCVEIKNSFACLDSCALVC